MTKKLYATATSMSNITNIRFTEAHNDAAPIVTVKAVTSTVDIGDDFEVELGYVGDSTNIFKGYVKSIDKSSSPTETTVTGYGKMIRAVDYFLASTNPESPFTRQNIDAEDLVKDLMAEAGLTNFGYDPTNFIFATQAPLEINLVSVYDYCKMIADTLAWHIYADSNGKVWFVERNPHLMSGDTPIVTITDSVISNLQFAVSERDLRNRIVVYGRNNIHAEALSSTSYDPVLESSRSILPAGFYKTVVASADWIDTQSMAQKAADYNLDLLNRLTVEATLVMEGNPNISARDIVTVNSASLSLNTDFYVYTIDQNWSSSGFTTTLTLRK